MSQFLFECLISIFCWKCRCWCACCRWTCWDYNSSSLFTGKRSLGNLIVHFLMFLTLLFLDLGCWLINLLIITIWTLFWRPNQRLKGTDVFLLLFVLLRQHLKLTPLWVRRILKPWQSVLRMVELKLLKQKQAKAQQHCLWRKSIFFVS